MKKFTLVKNLTNVLCVTIDLCDFTSFPKWFSINLIKLIKKKERFRKKYKKHKTIYHLNQIKHISKAIKNHSKYCFKQYCEKIEKNCFDNLKIFWSFIKVKNRDNG